MLRSIFSVRENVRIQLNTNSVSSIIDTSYGFSPTSRSIIPISTNHYCDKNGIWTFSGNHTTGGQGHVTIRLNKFLNCLPEMEGVKVQLGPRGIEGTALLNFISSLSSFTATPISLRPIFLTTIIEILPIPNQRYSTSYFHPSPVDVKIHVTSLESLWIHSTF